MSDVTKVMREERTEYSEYRDESCDSERKKIRKDFFKI